MKNSDCKLLEVFEQNLPTIIVDFDIRFIFRFLENGFLDFPVLIREKNWSEF